MSEPQPADALRTYGGLVEAFEAARASCPGLVTEAWYEFAGRPARIRIVGRRLAQAIDRPFTHLRSGPPRKEEPALRVDLWDQGETGIGCEGGDLQADPGANVEMMSTEDGRFVVHARARTRTGLDRLESHLVGWAADAEGLSLYELGRPLHAQLLLWLSDCRVQPVHAGFVARDRGGILLGGPGGSGKSTVALSCLQAGFRYLADDYVGLEARPDRGFVGHSLYVSTHLEPDHLTRFPGLAPHAIAGRLPGEVKSMVLLPDAFPGRYAGSAPISAIALPVVTRQPVTSWRRASAVETLLRLAPSSLFMLPHVGAGRGFDVLTALVQRVPTFWLDLGADLAEIPCRVDDMLDAALAEDS